MKIYEQFDAATAKIHAYAIFKGADYIGRIIVKNNPRRRPCLCLRQEWGNVMVRGYAGGGGYDKIGAAIASAYDNAKKEFKDNLPPLFAALESVTYNGEWRHNLESCGLPLHNVI